MRMQGKLELWMPALVLAGCAGELVGPGETAQLDQTGTAVLAPSEMKNSALTTSVLNATSAAAMGATQASRKVLTTAVICALDSTQSISFVVDGVSYAYTGGLGIAPGWTTSALTPTQASWVSACVFAAVNNLSMVVWVSVRGSVSSLVPSLTERTSYQIEEGAYWGNAFVDLGAIAAYSCDGVDQLINDTYADLPLRQCAQWDGVIGSNKSPCGMGYAGRCSSVCTTTSAPYAGCSFLGGAASDSVVTAFLSGVPL